MTYYRCDFAKELLHHTKDSGHEEKYHVECPICNSKVPCDVFEIHYSECATKNKNPVKCPYCDWSAQVSAWSLLEHKRNVHFYGPFKCGECKHVSDFAGGIVEHMIQTHDKSMNIFCPNCEDKLSQDRFEAHYEKCYSERIVSGIKCEKCDKTFKSRASYRNHRKAIHFLGTFKCQTCPLEVNYACDLVDHVMKMGHS